MPMSLEVRNLTKTYGDVRAVDHLSFEMPAPGAFGLIGTNGAGKTTTIRMTPRWSCSTSRSADSTP